MGCPAVGGDDDAFGALFERHSRAVYNFAFRWTADWAAAEDLASEVFLTAWRRRREVVFTTESGSVLPLVARRGHQPSAQPAAR